MVYCRHRWVADAPSRIQVEIDRQEYGRSSQLDVCKIGNPDLVRTSGLRAPNHVGIDWSIVLRIRHDRIEPFCFTINPLSLIRWISAG
jgi:hypothetical protein